MKVPEQFKKPLAALVRALRKLDRDNLAGRGPRSRRTGRIEALRAISSLRFHLDTKFPALSERKVRVSMSKQAIRQRMEAKLDAGYQYTRTDSFEFQLLMKHVGRGMRPIQWKGSTFFPKWAVYLALLGATGRLKDAIASPSVRRAVESEMRLSGSPLVNGAAIT